MIQLNLPLTPSAIYILYWIPVYIIVQKMSFSCTKIPCFHAWKWYFYAWKWKFRRWHDLFAQEVFMGSWAVHNFMHGIFTHSRFRAKFPFHPWNAWKWIFHAWSAIFITWNFSHGLAGVAIKETNRVTFSKACCLRDHV